MGAINVTLKFFLNIHNFFLSTKLQVILPFTEFRNDWVKIKDFKILQFHNFLEFSNKKDFSRTCSRTAAIFYLVLGYYLVFICKDTIRKRLQIQGFEEGRKSLGATTKYINMRHCILTMYRQENGLKSFYKGYIPGMAKAFISSGLYFSLFELFKHLLVEGRLHQ